MLFRSPRDQAKAALDQPQPSGLRNGRVQTAAVTNVRDLPDQWFGYAAADLVVLTTGSAPPEFLDELFDPQPPPVHLAHRPASLAGPPEPAALS